MWVLLGATYRAVLASSDFSLHLVGPTGAGKTELAALAQQHLGASFDARRLPGAWSSTGNSLESLAFHAKDALLVVDDFAPSGSPQDVARFHREADRFLRAQGNTSGRGRLGPDGTLRAVRQPRGLTLSTGEDVPRGQSLRARLFAVEVGPNGVNWDELTRAQEHARDGHLALAMAGYLRWLAPRYGEVHQTLRATVDAIRTGLQGRGHRRTSTIEANLLLGITLVLAYAAEVGAITPAEREPLWEEAKAAIAEAAETQAEHQRAAEPTSRFLDLLRSAVTSGEAHLGARGGGEPPNPAAWGWRARERSYGDQAGVEWQPMGKRVGWVDGDDLYLDQEAAHRAAQAAAGPGGESLTVGPQVLARRLKEKGLLVETDPDGRHLGVRENIEGVRRRVLHLRTSTLFPLVSCGQADQEKMDLP
jgi:hypothetical protein